MQKNKIKKELKVYKYHICYSIRVLTVGSKIAIGNSREIKKYANDLLTLAQDEDSFNRTLNTVCSCIEQCISSSKDISDDLLLRSKKFTKRLTQSLNTYIDKSNLTEFLNKGDIVSCQVTAINEYNIEIKIKTEDSRKKGSIHISKIANRRINSISDEVELGEILQAKLLSNFDDYPFGWSLSLLPQDLKIDNTP